jgi:hypothetical protein
MPPRTFDPSDIIDQGPRGTVDDPTAIYDLIVTQRSGADVPSGEGYSLTGLQTVTRRWEALTLRQVLTTVGFMLNLDKSATISIRPCVSRRLMRD